jgi:hypothetical protein
MNSDCKSSYTMGKTEHIQQSVRNIVLNAEQVWLNLFGCGRDLNYIVGTKQRARWRHKKTNKL